MPDNCSIHGCVGIGIATSRLLDLPTRYRRVDKRVHNLNTRVVFSEEKWTVTLGNRNVGRASIEVFVDGLYPIKS